MKSYLSNIAIVGKMHSGKTTLAKALIDAGYERVAFADPVKEISASMMQQFEDYYIAPHNRYVWNKERIEQNKGASPIRKLLQLVGTELGRDFYGPKDIWIKILLEKTAGMKNVVNDDCRFINEGQALKSAGWLIVKLHRPEDERVQSIINSLKQANPKDTPQEISEKLSAMLAHPSETEIDDIDYHVKIRSTNVKSLQTRVRDLLLSHDFENLNNSDLVEENNLQKSIEHDGLIQPMTAEQREKVVDLVTDFMKSNDLPNSMRAHHAHG